MAKRAHALALPARPAARSLTRSAVLRRATNSLVAAGERARHVRAARTRNKTPRRPTRGKPVRRVNLIFVWHMKYCKHTNRQQHHNNRQLNQNSTILTLNERRQAIGNPANTRYLSKLPWQPVSMTSVITSSSNDSLALPLWTLYRAASENKLDTRQGRCRFENGKNNQPDSCHEVTRATLASNLET